MQVKVISVLDKNEWNNVIIKTRQYDFYHTNYYSQLDRLGASFLFVVEHNDEVIALPLIKRIIEGTDYFDCTSVWGYPGPVASKLPEELDADLLDYFKIELKEYLFKNKIVSAFSRLHPIIPQVEFFEDFGRVNLLNKTVAIDTKLPLETQRQQFRKTNKSEINQLRNRGHSVKVADKEEEIDEFVNIYTETMERVNAGTFYFDSFDKKYFHSLLNADEFKARLLIAYKDGIITAGGVFIATKNFMQYHVAGTKQEYMKATPMKLIIDEARLLATQLNLEYFHLGGGVGGSDEDSLFWFKSGFSDLTFTYKTWQLIVNEAVYENFVKEKMKEKTLNENYFPLYRG